MKSAHPIKDEVSAALQGDSIVSESATAQVESATPRSPLSRITRVALRFTIDCIDIALTVAALAWLGASSSPLVAVILKGVFHG